MHCRARLLGSIVDRMRSLFHPRDDIVICRSNPLHNLCIVKVYLGGIEAQRIAPTRFGCFHPVGADWLPVQLDSGDIA